MNNRKSALQIMNQNKADFDRVIQGMPAPFLKQVSTNVTKIIDKYVNFNYPETPVLLTGCGMRALVYYLTTINFQVLKLCSLFFK